MSAFDRLFLSYSEKLFLAIENRDYQKLKNLIGDNNLAYLQRDIKAEYTPLTLAAKKGYSEMVHLLIVRGAQDPQVLPAAVESGDVPTVQFLLGLDPKQYSFLDFNNDSSGFLHSSLNYLGNVEIVDLLLNRIRNTQYTQYKKENIRNNYLIEGLNNAFLNKRWSVAERLEPFVIEYVGINAIIIYAIQVKSYKMLNRFIERVTDQQSYFIFLKESVCKGKGDTDTTISRFLMNRMEELNIQDVEDHFILNKTIICAYNRFDMETFKFLLPYVVDMEVLNDMLDFSTKEMNSNRQYEQNRARQRMIENHAIMQGLILDHIDILNKEPDILLFNKLRLHLGEKQCQTPAVLNKTTIKQNATCFDTISSEDYNIIEFLNGIDPNNENSPEDIEKEKNDRIVFFIGTKDNLIPNCYKKSYLMNSNFYGTTTDSVIMLPFPRIYVYVRDLLKALETGKHVFFLLPCQNPSVLKIDETEISIHNIYACEGRRGNPLYPIEFESTKRRLDTNISLPSGPQTRRRKE